MGDGSRGRTLFSSQELWSQEDLGPQRQLRAGVRPLLNAPFLTNRAFSLLNPQICCPPDPASAPQAPWPSCFFQAHIAQRQPGHPACQPMMGSSLARLSKGSCSLRPWSSKPAEPNPGRAILSLTSPVPGSQQELRPGNCAPASSLGFPATPKAAAGVAGAAPGGSPPGACKVGRAFSRALITGCVPEAWSIYIYLQDLTH